MRNPFRSKKRLTPEQISAERASVRQATVDGETERQIVHYERELPTAAKRTIKTLHRKKYPTLKRQPWDTLHWQDEDRICWLLASAPNDPSIRCEHPKDCNCGGENEDGAEPKCQHVGRGRCMCPAKYSEHILLVSSGEIVWFVGSRYEATPTPVELDIRDFYRYFLQKPHSDHPPRSRVIAEDECVEMAQQLLSKSLRNLRDFEEFSPSTATDRFNY